MSDPSTALTALCLRELRRRLEQDGLQVQERDHRLFVGDKCLKVRAGLTAATMGIPQRAYVSVDVCPLIGSPVEGDTFGSNFAFSLVNTSTAIIEMLPSILKALET